MKKNALYAAAIVVVFLAGLTAAIRPSIASGNDGAATITCTSVTFSYVAFANAENTVNESVSVDGSVVHSGPFTFTGASGGHTVTISVPADGAMHTVAVSSNWDTHGHEGSFSDSSELKCGEPPITTEPPTTTEPPGERCPPGEVPIDGKDGDEGNEECCPDKNGDGKCDEETPAPTQPPVTTTVTTTTAPTPTMPPVVTTPTEPEETTESETPETGGPAIVQPRPDKPKPNLPPGATPPKEGPTLPRTT